MKFRVSHSLLAISLLSLLSACGGGGGGGDTGNGGGETATACVWDSTNWNGCNWQ